MSRGYGDRMREWRKSPVVALVAIALFAILQVTIPLMRLDDDARAQRFGWQMFSTYSPQIEFTVNTQEGTEPVDIDEIVARLRADLPLEEVVPPYICETTPSALEVTWDGQEYEC